MALSCVFPPSPFDINASYKHAMFHEDDIAHGLSDGTQNPKDFVVNSAGMGLSNVIDTWGTPHTSVAEACLLGDKMSPSQPPLFQGVQQRGGYDTSSRVSESKYQSLDKAATKMKREFLKHIRFSSLNMLDSNGKSALHKATQEGNAEVTQILLDDPNFEHVNTKDTTILKWTALHEAAGVDKLEIVKMLMDHERFLQTNARDRNGRSCLHIAAGQGSFKLVNAIVSHPRFTSVVSKDNLGFTPQQRARANGHEVIADYIHACHYSMKPPGLGQA